jgi:hypothetical protein
MEGMEGAVYILCGFTALLCSVLLMRGYWNSQVRLILWSACFFLALAVENIILFVDLILVPDIDLSIVRNSTALSGVLLLTYGLIWENR